MNLKYLIAKGLKILLNPPALNNCSIDKTAHVCSRSELTNVHLGRYSYIGNQCFLVNVEIGSFCSIADRCCMGGATHPIDRVSSSPVFHNGRNVLRKNFSDAESIRTPVTTIENDVWIGMGSYVKAGVTIHNGAVIGMGSIVTKDVPSYEIWAGNPARKIGERFDKNISKLVESSKWWECSEEELSEVACLFEDVERFVEWENKK